MSVKKRIGVLISGRGSNLQALIEACKAPDYPAEIAAVISNRPEAAGLDRAAQAGLPALTIDHTLFPSRAAFERGLDDALREAKAELICSAGFMRRLTAHFVEAWRDRQINIHPSLLPAFRGLHTHEQVIKAGVRISGCTVHYVRTEVDTGPIIAQAAVPVLPSDTPETLAARVLAAEHKLYPFALGLVASGKVWVEGEMVIFADGFTACPPLFSPHF